MGRCPSAEPAFPGNVEKTTTIVDEIERKPFCYTLYEQCLTEMACLDEATLELALIYDTGFEPVSHGCGQATATRRH